MSLSPKLTTHNPILNTHPGLTLIELLIAGSLSAFIFLLVTNTLLGSIRSQTASSATTSLQKTTVSIISDISNQARWAKKVVVNTHSKTIDVTDFTDRVTSYELKNSQLIKTLPGNTPTPLNPRNVKITQFDLTTNGPPTKLTGFTIQLGLTHNRRPDLIINSTNSISIRINQFGKTE